MKYFLTQLLLLIVSVTLLYYFSTLEYFVPFDAQGELNWYNFMVVLFLLFLAFQSALGVGIYAIQKVLAYGVREFPDKSFALKWSLTIAFMVTFLLLLHIFHLLSFGWGLLLMILILLAVIFIF